MTILTQGMLPLKSTPENILPTLSAWERASYITCLQAAIAAEHPTVTPLHIQLGLMILSDINSNTSGPRKASRTTKTKKPKPTTSKYDDMNMDEMISSISNTTTK